MPIAEAASLAGMDDYTPVYIQKQESHSDQFLRELGIEEANLLGRYNLLNFPSMPILKALNNEFDFALFNDDPSGMYSHCLLPETVTSF